MAANVKAAEAGPGFIESASQHPKEQSSAVQLDKGRAQDAAQVPHRLTFRWVARARMLASIDVGSGQ